MSVYFDKPMFSGGKFLITGKVCISPGGELRAARYELDPVTGEIKSILKVHNEDIEYGRSNGLYLADDGKTAILDHSEFDLLTRNILLRFDDDDQILWAYHIPFNSTGYALKQQRIFKTKDNGWVTWNGVLSEYQKFTDQGLLYNCTNTPVKVVTQRINPLPSFIPTLAFRKFTGIKEAINIQLVPMSLNDTKIECADSVAVCNPCERSIACNSVRIHGPDSVCSPNNRKIFFAERDSGCNVKVNWTIDPAFASIVATTDSTIELNFLKAGTGMLYAQLADTCKIIRDSFLINSFRPPVVVNLGPDNELCNFSTYPLHAGPGFLSYRWQDGSTDSIFTAIEPGRYHVTVTDHCGNQLSDTIVLSKGLAPTLDLGPDLIKCATDTVTITAPGGFLNYLWSSNYRINRNNSQTIKSYTEVDTMYVVTAEQSPGCLAVDSIRIKIKEGTRINLGVDTSFCEGDSLLIDAGAGFENYKWNNGTTSQSFYVTDKGVHWVTALSNGCMATDTIIIKDLYKRPMVSLGNDIALCTDATINLSAGGNYVTYNWQDGSTDPVFTTNTAGTYWLKVTDQHGCSNQDTVIIVPGTSIPGNILDAEAEICRGQPLQINAPTGYSKYRWSNNAASRNITITAPGIYWLEITDANGCMGRDTIQVKLKDCGKGVYFPNAFTPNGDLQNNSFRPLVHGQLVSFYMVIYNRYGQKIFETKDPLKGWDGMFNGHQQGVGTYVWMSRYKLSGSPMEQTVRGTVTLVR
jgi:gliding motility-associated-like protein